MIPCFFIFCRTQTHPKCTSLRRQYASKGGRSGQKFVSFGRGSGGRLSISDGLRSYCAVSRIFKGDSRNECYLSDILCDLAVVLPFIDSPCAQLKGSYYRVHDSSLADGLPILRDEVRETRRVTLLVLFFLITWSHAVENT